MLPAMVSPFVAAKRPPQKNEEAIFELPIPVRKKFSVIITCTKKKHFQHGRGSHYLFEYWFFTKYLL